MSKQTRLHKAIRTALGSGIAASAAVAVTSALAQEEDILEQPRQFVTGSRILRTTTETSTPITTITREQIDAAGDTNISDILRRVSANTFGSFRERSGFSGGGLGNSAIDLRGLGPGRTLVLLDGRRMAGSPGMDGSQANLNLIPFAAVERIEILRSGASAIYGSDAIAGVVNVILRKDYDGVHLGVMVGRPTQDGGDEEQANMVGGVSSSKGNITFAVDYSRKSMIFNGDRTFSAVGTSSFGFPGSLFAYTNDLSPGGPFGSRVIGIQPDPRCPANLNTDPNFPNSAIVGPFCRFNYASTSANEARIKRQSVFIKGDFDIGNDMTFFTRVIATQNESFGRYAPTPQVGGATFAPTMAATNPNNPTVGQSFTLPDLALDANSNIITLTTSTTYNGPYDLSIFYRNVPGGFRDTTVDDTLLDIVAGVQGALDIFRGSEWSASLQSSRAKAADTSAGLASRPGLQQVIDDGSFDIFGVNGPTDPVVAATFVVDGFTDAETDVILGDATLNFDLGELPSGPVSWAWGVEYEDSSYNSDFDAIANAGNIDGSAGGTDVRGKRSRRSLFGEALIPLLSNLELDVALRYDDYSDFGSEVSPMVGVAYRPVDQFLVRGTYGEGYRAPDMDQLYGPQVQGVSFAIDTSSCIAVGDIGGPPAPDGPPDGIPDVDQDPSLFPAGHPCVLTQYNSLVGGNPMLDAETSENYGLGVVWSPTEDITLGVDYYNIEIEDQIPDFSTGAQTILDREAMGVPEFVALVTRDSFGRIAQIDRRLQNASGLKTDGLDFEASWNFSLGRVGEFRTTANFSHVLDYKIARLPGDSFGTHDFLPEDLTRGTAGLGWQRGDFTGQLNINYISTATNSVIGYELSTWLTFDLQVSWDTPWQGKLSVGARNLTNEDPPLDLDPNAIGNPFYLQHWHDVYGRIPYIRYEQDL